MGRKREKKFAAGDTVEIRSKTSVYHRRKGRVVKYRSTGDVVEVAFPKDGDWSDTALFSPAELIKKWW